jgi:hypothetical protein
MDHTGDTRVRIRGWPLIAASDDDQQSGSEREMASSTHVGETH